MFWRSTHSKSFWLGTLGCGAAALAFLLLYEWIVYKVPVTDIYLPASSWSDEVVYSKQLSAVVQYGAPQGYFGFNESHAEIDPVLWLRTRRQYAGQDYRPASRRETL